MSHSLGNPTGAMMLQPVTIIDYRAGGELLSDAGNIFGLTASAAAGYMVQGTIAASQNSLGVVLFPTFTNFVLRLYQMSGGSLTEIPNTTGLNAIFNLLVKAG
jgi:hypothetical protein